MRLRNRAGYTLVEAIAALTLLGVLLSVTLAALNTQVRLFSSLSAQTDAVQNGRFALGVLEKDLPAAGMNVPPEQPFIVYADTHVVAINGDLVSNMPNDPFAMYVDPSVSEQYATALTKARRSRIPRTSAFYPDTSYRTAGQNSPAETIQFFVDPDTSTERRDDYILYRRINHSSWEMIARGLLRIPGVPFFEYFRRVTPPGAAPYLERIAANQLPLRHVRPIHGAADDTGAVARIDALRAVRVNFRVVDGQRPPRERIYNFNRTIPLLNAGLGVKKTCGDEPILGNVNFVAQAGLVDNSPVVRLSWAAGTDDRAGERDVVRYVIYRTTDPDDVGDPYLSIPAGEATYSFVDTAVVGGQAYYYYLAAQDCASSLSDLASSMTIVPAE
jgi:type II secretory pathway pseudopilin PulG